MLREGTDGNESFSGTSEDDILKGNGGNDSINGQGGNDELYGGTGDDQLRGGTGVDFFDGGEGFDRVSFTETGTTQGAIADLRTGIIENDGHGNREIFTEIESLGGGTPFADVFYGDDADNFLIAGHGDRVFGFGGNDRFVVTDAFNDDAVPELIDGGEGVDQFDFANRDITWSAVTIDLQAETMTNARGTTILRNFEDVLAGPLSDVLLGSVGSNFLSGGGGNDQLSGRDGNDLLTGGVGDDIIDGGSGDDVARFVAPTLAGTPLIKTQSTYQGAPVTLIQQEVNGSLETLFRISSNGTGLLVEGLNSASPLGSDLITNVELLQFQAGETPLPGQVLTLPATAPTPLPVDDVIYVNEPDVRLDTGDGNDGIYVGRLLSIDDSVRGGTGTDTLAIQGNYPSLVLGDVTGIEVLLVASGADTRFGDTAGNRYDYSITSQDGNVAAGQTLTVSAAGLLAGEDLSFNGSAETDGNFRVFAGSGTDSLVGGRGNDGFFFGADGNFTSADRLWGGDGTDTLALRGNYAAALGEESMRQIEVLTLLSGLRNEFGGPIVTEGFDYALTMADGNVAAGQTLAVIAATLSASESLFFDGRAETDGAYRIISGAGADTLFGGAGSDLISGGDGADVLDGGVGADSYVYRFVSDSDPGAPDTITLGSGDKIDLSMMDGDSTTAVRNLFRFIGDEAFSNQAGQLRAYQSDGKWIVEADVNGDSVADFVLNVITDAAITSDTFPYFPP